MTDKANTPRTTGTETLPPRRDPRKASRGLYRVPCRKGPCEFYRIGDVLVAMLWAAAGVAS